MSLKRFSALYVSGALMLANTLAILIVLNAGAYLVLSLYQHLSQDNPVAKKYDKKSLKIVYPLLSEGEIQALLKETWSRPFVYEPFTQFKERVYHGKYVNVGIDGFRYGKDQAAWPPPEGEINIFVFGGSTTFGYGVADNQTIASCLQDDMRSRLKRKANIYNFGRGFYFSTQERILFEGLLASGHVPDLAIFIDGLNDFYQYDGNPLYTERLREYMSGEIPKITFLSKLPVVKLFHALSGNRNHKLLASTGGPGNMRYDDPEVLGGVIKRYFGNKKIIESVAAAYGVRTAFVWQPVPSYEYDISHHLFSGADFGPHTFSHYGYPLMKKYISEQPKAANFLWAADIQKDSKEPLYVDQVHYTAEFSRRLADVISQYLVENFY